MNFLTSTFPKARFAQGVEPGQVVAWASTKDHEKIKTLVDQLIQESPTDVAVYSLKSITAASALQVLQSAVPDAKLTVDAEDPQRLTALAKSEDHEAIKKIIETIDVEGATDSAATAVIYTLDRMDASAASYAVSFLTTAFPKARFVPGARPGQVVAWATPKDHTEIKNLIDQMIQEPAAELAPKVAVYDLKFITPASAQQILQTAVPQAQFTVDAGNPQRLTAWARPSEHETIAGIVKDIDVEGEESSSQAVVYTLEAMDPSGSTYIVPFLTGAFPKARFSQGVEPGQVVAWATAKEHEQIKALIDQLGQASPENAPTAAVYSLKSITASDAIQFLQTAVPRAQFTPNASDPQRLTAWARPSHQEAIENVLKIIDVESDAASSSNAVIYKIKGMGPSTGLYKLRFLSNAFPKANFTLGAESDQIVAWATAKDHEEIKNLIDQFGEEAASEIVVYSLKNISATNASSVIQTAVPQARITMDADNPQRLTAWARQEDHDAIQKILATIDVEGDEDSSATVVVYRLEGMTYSGATYAVRFLTSTFPKARFTAGVEPGQVVAWASAKDHEQIQILVDQLTEQPESDVAVYSLKSITAASALQVLQTAVPKAKFTPDAGDPQRLTAVASSEDHEAVKKILETIDVEGDVDSAATAVIYTMKGMTASSAYYRIQFLTRAFPKATFTQGAAADQIVAWATPKDQEEIKGLIDQFDEEAASEIVVYSLKNISATNASSVLRTAVPQAQVTTDIENPQRLTAWARQEDHDTIQEVLATVDVEGAADSAATAVIYTLEGLDATGAIYAVRFLTTAFPKARIVSGAQPGQVVAWATPKDHTEIKTLIDQMGQGPPPELAPKLTVYGLKFVSGADASQVLQTAVPQAKFTVSREEPQRLSVWARPSEHDTIAAILQELDVEGDVESSSTAIVYTLEGMSPSGAFYAVRFLGGAVPKAQFTVGVEPGQIVAWASAKDHEQIKTLVDSMTKERATDVAVYSLKAITAAGALQVLQSAVPKAKLNADRDNPQRLTALASSEDHEAIKKILETIDVEGDADSAANAVIYTMKGMDSRSGYYRLQFLTRAFPKATFTQGAEADQIVAWATAKDHEKIKSLIDQFDEEAASEIVVYSLKNITATNASGVLRTAVPQAEITVDADNPQRMTAWARQEDHDTIQKVLTTIDVEGDEDSSATVVVYRLEGMRSSGAIYAVRFLMTTFPKARFTSGVEPGQIVAWASAKDHEQIQTLVDQMTEEPESDVAVYSLKSITAAGALQVLQSAVPKAKLTPDIDDPQRLTAVASSEDHEAIKKILDTIDVEGAADSAAAAVIYTIKGMDTRTGYYKLRFLASAFPKASFTMGAEGDQIVAWATAKDQEKIKKLIDQFGEEAASEIVVYSLKNTSATNASGVLRTAVPQAEITVDTDNPQRLTAWARQEDHDTIEKVLATIDVEGDADSAAMAVIYTLEGMDASGASYAVTFLTTAFPKARIVLGSQPGQVVAWATPKDHTEIKSLIDQLSQGPPPELAPKVTVYGLKFISAADASQVLQTAVPQAQFTVSADAPQRLAAWARPSEHQVIAGILQELDTEGDAESASRAVVYKLEGMSAQNALYTIRFLMGAVPKARFTQGAKAEQVVAWATAKDHAEIKSLIEQLGRKAVSEIVVYSLKNISASNASTVLQTAVPEAKLTMDNEDPQRLTAYASQPDHQKIKTILEKIDVESDAAFAAKVVIYTLEGMDVTTAGEAQEFLTTTFPDARFALGAEAGQMVAWAAAKDHEDIQALVDQLNQGPSPEQAPKASVYAVKNISAADAMQVLEAAVPQANFTAASDDPQRLTAWARPSEHDTITAILQEIDVEGDAESASRVGIYTLEGMESRSVYYAIRFLMGVFPTARFTQGAKEDQVVAWATAKDQEEIKSLIDQLGKAEATEVVIYTLEGMDTRRSAYTLRFLFTAFPTARFTEGSEPGQLVAWASAKDHQQIKALVDQLNQGPPPDQAQKIAVYTVKNITAQSAMQVLSEAVPTADVTVDARDPQRLTAWARPSEHEAIDSILTEIDIEGDAESASRAVIYTLEGMDSRGVLYAIRFLMSAFPEASFTQGAQEDQVVAWAAPTDHKEIENLVEQMGQEAASEIVVYALKNISATSASSVLRTAVPQAELTIDTEDPQRLTAWARATDHDTIKTILEKIDVESDPASGAGVVIYTLEGMDSRNSAYTYRFLTTTFPKARFTMGTQPGQLVAWASAKDHEEIKALVDQLNKGLPPELAPNVAVYSMKNISAAAAMQVLSTAVPKAQLTVDEEDPQRLTAWASPKDHDTIDTILQQIDVEGDDASAAKVVIYTLDGMDATAASAALPFLTSTFPKARFALGAEAGQLVAWAAAKDHVDIKTLVDQLNEGLPPEMAPKVGVYALKNISGTEATEVLQAAVPEANFTVATDDPKRLTAWARPSDHQKIDEILQEIDVEADAESAARAAIYVLEGMSRTGAIYSVRFLQQAVPDANFTLGSDLTQLVAWASPKDHETIKELVKQLIEESPDSARTAKVYGLKHATAESAIQTLSTALPEVTFNVGADSSQLVAWARPNDHKKIEQIVEQLEMKGPPETEPQAIVYILPSASATEAMRVLRETVPQAKLTIGSEPHQLIAWARPADHEIIKEIVDKMTERGPDDLSPKVAVYRVQAGDAEGAIEFLQSAVPDADFSVGSDPRRLIAWATPSDHEVIKKAVEEMTTGADQISTQVYRFRYADPMAAYAVLGSLVPSATIAIDQIDRTLVVSGMPEDHAKIKETIDEMDRDDVEGQRPVVQVHRILVGDPANVFQSLTQLFQRDTAVQLSLDEQNDTVLAVASPAKHERIAEMIKAVAEVAQQDDDTTMELYPMKNIDSLAAMDVLDQLLQKQSSKAEVSYDYRSNQLVAIGRPEDHEVIKKTLEQLRTEDLVLEIYELDYVDPLSAEMAISRQYSEEGANAPQIDTDPMTEQLFVRASEEQQKEIRDLLIKMGETKLKFLEGRDGRAMRTLRLQGDVSKALEEIQRLWPTLRDNEIRIVSPDTPVPPSKPAPAAEKPADKAAVAAPAKLKSPKKKPADKAARAPAGKPAAAKQSADKPVEPPKEKAAPKKSVEGKADNPKRAKGKAASAKANAKDRSRKTTMRDDAAWGNDWFFVAHIQSGEATEEETEKPKPSADDAEKPTDQNPPVPAAKQTEETEAESPAKPPPLFVVPGDNSVTIVSDDPEALRQFEELLRTLLPGSAEIGRNISIFELENSNAIEVAERLRELFSSSLSSWRRGTLPVAIVPDERLNTIVVQGSRIDRETIEGLVRVLDSDQGEGAKPRLIPLRFADAGEVASVIQDVFRSRMTPTTSRSRTSTSVRRQTPSVAVDEKTNSLVVMATSPLLEEIVELANTLDQTAGENPARRVKIISLKKASASRVEEALQRILNSRSPTTRRAR